MTGHPVNPAKEMPQVSFLSIHAYPWGAMVTSRGSSDTVVPLKGKGFCHATVRA
jgi:hypothetical protein